MSDSREQRISMESVMKQRSRYDEHRQASSSGSKRRSSRDRSGSRSKHKKSKKKKKKRNSSSDSSSVDSELEELKLLQRLEAEKVRLKEERRKQKELAKANETPEQKRARRLVEKQEKERKRRQRMGWDGEYQCYTDQDNPFGDSALTNTFVWSKKLAKEGIKNISREELELQNRQKQMENKVELEKVKARRLIREQARLEAERSLSEAARAREAQHFSSWNKQEDAFQLQQAKLRSHIRIRDGRAKPIDLLAWYVSSERSVDALEMHEPYSYLNGLQINDLEDLAEDIKVYMELQDAEESQLSYWSDVFTIVQDELSKAKRVNAVRLTREPVHDTVAQDVAEIFKGKSTTQLEALEKQISTKISGKQDGVDIGYWESLLSQLKAHMARARLRNRHQNNLRHKLQLLKEEQGLDQQPHNSEPNTNSVQEEEREEQQEKEISCDEERSKELYLNGNYSPKVMKEDSLEGISLLEEKEEIQRVLFLRESLLNKHTQAQQSALSSAPSCAMEREARKGITEEDKPFSAEATLQTKHYVWADKYRPRKPRYFNRVHTGFEWNKYNQTHYDMDNPPPKIVQGYKFNIFYPDLIDNNTTPHFSLKPCEDNSEFAILRFEAGPPYEDIAFKIVNREWEYSYKRGFRCHFHNNIFQLWFHFKRYRYRR